MSFLPGMMPSWKRGSTFAVSPLVQQFTATDASTYTFSSVNFGAADPDRKIVVAFNRSKVEPEPSITSVTIGGITASAISGATTDTTNNSAFMYEASVPTGTSGDIVVVFSDTTVRIVVGVWRVISGTSSGGQGSSTASGGDSAITVTIPTGGVGIYFAYESANGEFLTWTNLTTEDFDQVVETTRSGSGGRRTTAGSTAVTADINNFGALVLVGCAYGP